MDTAHGKDKAHDPGDEGRGQGDASHKHSHADPGKQRHEARCGDIQHSIWTWARLGGQCFQMLRPPCRVSSPLPLAAEHPLPSAPPSWSSNRLSSTVTTSEAKDQLVRSKCFPGPLHSSAPCGVDRSSASQRTQPDHVKSSRVAPV